MKLKILFLAVIFIISALIIVFFRGGIKSLVEVSSKFPYSSSREMSAREPLPSSPMQGAITLLEKPLLGVPVALVFSFKSVAPAPNIEAKIELPSAFELISGTPDWKGELETNEEHKIEVIIKSTKVGYYQLNGSAISRQGVNTYFGTRATIDIEITPNDVIPDRKPENIWYDPAAYSYALPLPQNNEQIKSELILSNTPGLNKNFTITYRATPSVKIPSKRTYLNLTFPPRAFKLIDVQFPQGGETHQSNTLLGWIGNIDENQTVEITATFKVINVGWGTVYGSLSFLSADSVRDVKMAELYVGKYGNEYSLNTPAPAPAPSSSTTTDNLFIKPEPTSYPSQPFSND